MNFAFEIKKLRSQLKARFAYGKENGDDSD